MFLEPGKLLFEWLGNFNIGRFLQETFLVAVITYITFGLFSFALTKTDQYQTLSPRQTDGQAFPWGY